MSSPRILIACIGNIFLGDDGFGSAVAARLAERSLPEDVLVRDFGIRGIDLTYALRDPYELVILVDACSRGGEAGTVYVIEPDPAEPVAGPHLDAHDLNPMAVLRAVRSMGGAKGRILVVGCEPGDLGSEEDGKMGLSDAVAGAIDQAIHKIEELISDAVVARKIGV